MPSKTSNPVREERAREAATAQATLAGITIYPLKSAAGIALPEAVLDALGLRHDRRWAVAGADGGVLTQRTRPRLARIRVALEGGSLVLGAPGMPRLELPLEPAGGPSARRQEVVVWKDRVTALRAGERATRWISDWLDEPCALVYMPASTRRPVDPTYAVGEDRVSFADGFPLLLLSEASLDGLNRRLDVPLPMNRFRPNLVVRGVGAHAEDRWRRIRIGGIVFHVVKSCGRCAITTVDQETGTRGQEPLRTLARYRRAAARVLFGRYLVHRGTGGVRVGDAIEVLETDPLG